MSSSLHNVLYFIVEVEHLINKIETKSLKIQIKAKPIDCCQLLLSELPSIEMAHLELLIERMIGQGKEFTLKELENSRALLEFKRSMPDEGISSFLLLMSTYPYIRAKCMCIVSTDCKS